MADNHQFGDVILAPADKKIDYALGLMSWHGWYLILTGMLEIFGIDRDSRRNKRFIRHLRQTDYSIYFKRF